MAKSHDLKYKEAVERNINRMVIQLHRCRTFHQPESCRLAHKYMEAYSEGSIWERLSIRKGDNQFNSVIHSHLERPLPTVKEKR